MPYWSTEKSPNKTMLSKCCFHININFYVFVFLTFIFLVFVEKKIWFSVLVTMCRPCEQLNTPKWVCVFVHSVIVEYDSRETCWSCTPMTMRHIITRSGGVFESNTFRLRLNTERECGQFISFIYLSHRQLRLLRFDCTLGISFWRHTRLHSLM